jgi:hypothetical protein
MQVKIKNARIAFPVLFEPQQFKGEGKPRFSCKIMVPKSDKAGVAAINEAIAAVAKEGWPKNPKMVDSFKGNSNKFCLIDGDLSGVEGNEGYWILSANRSETQGRPTVVGRTRQPLTKEDGVIYSGCRCNFILDIWAQTKDYPGIRCRLDGVQFAGDDEAFSGGSRVTADDFDDVDDGADADDLA